MDERAQEIFETLVEKDHSVCSRCFQPTKSRKERAHTHIGGPPCADDCGKLSASLESGSISLRTQESRAKNLVALMKENGYEIDVEVFLKAMSQFGCSTSPKRFFVKCLSYGIGERPEDDLFPKVNAKGANSGDESSTQEQKTLYENLVESGPIQTSSWPHQLGEEEQSDQIEELPLPGVPGLYYLKASHRPNSLIQTVIEETNVFWSANTSALASWMEEMDNEISSQAVPEFVSQIRSEMSRYASAGEEYERFRDSALWAVKKDDAMTIMGHLRKSGEPQSTDEIASKVGLSIGTTKHLLRALETNDSVTLTRGIGREALWKPPE